MAFSIGYNISKANDLMDDIADAFKNLEIYTQEQWEPLKTTLRSHWVGEDEQDFEKKLVERLLALYESAYQLTSNSVTTIGALAQAWYDFQKKNTIDGNDSQFAGSLTPDVPTVKKQDNLIEFKEFTIDAGADRGLQSATSSSTIQSAITVFINDVKTKTNTLFDEIQTNSAFFGEQSGTVKTYLEKIGYAVSEITSAIKDMHEALNKLTLTNYLSSNDSVKEQFTQANSDIETSLNDLGQSRWS